MQVQECLWLLGYLSDLKMKILPDHNFSFKKVVFAKFQIVCVVSLRRYKK